MTTVELQALAGLLGAAGAEIVFRCGRCGYEAVSLTVADLVTRAAEDGRAGVELLGSEAIQKILAHECRPRSGATA